MRNLRALSRVFLAMATLLFACATGPADAQIMRTLYTFQGKTDGRAPVGALIRDQEGNFYGVTILGGDVSCRPEKYVKGCGTVFRLSRGGELTTLYSFHGGSDGMLPRARLLRDKSGALYGTTYLGGNGPCYYFFRRTYSGCGTVFKLAPDGTETILHAFQGGNDGEFPTTALTLDHAGNVYGTVEEGSSYVYKIMPDGSLSILTGFSNNSPSQAGLTLHGRSLYGTTVVGGQDGGGTAFRLTLNGQMHLLASFYASNGGLHGPSEPTTALVFDMQSNIYGTTQSGGTGCTGNSSAEGCGTVFKLTPDGTVSTLYAFTSTGDGADPESDLAIDKNGNLYGTASSGGIGWQECAPGYVCGNGVIFKVASDGTYTLLHALGGGADGSEVGGLLLDREGNLYGVVSDGGIGGGYIFELTP
jgi:uncharacterized repeat protein (TIGR03803 family)